MAHIFIHDIDELETQTSVFLVKSEATKNTTRWLRYRSYIFLGLLLMVLTALISCRFNACYLYFLVLMLLR